MIKFYKKFLFIFLILIFNNLLSLKCLHLTFHKGTESELKFVAEKLNLDLTTWYIHDLPKYYLDELSSGNVLFSIGHDRAKRIWEKHKLFFNKFDVIITSDTAPLSRIFLQNNYKGHLVIWVCNRFDYYDKGSSDGTFPDMEYYNLINKAVNSSNVTVIPYSSFETYYAKNKSYISFNHEVINPIGISYKIPNSKYISNNIKKDKFFIADYCNNNQFLLNNNKLNNLGIKFYTGRYAGPKDLIGFKGIINIPGAWCNLSMYESIGNGLVHFIPTKNFLLKLFEKGLFMPDHGPFINGKNCHLNDWYRPELKELIVYFESWPDLLLKINKTNFNYLSEKCLQFHKKHKSKVLLQWKSVFKNITYS